MLTFIFFNSSSRKDASNTQNNHDLKDREITWYNLYLQGELSDQFVKNSLKSELISWVKSLVKEFYPYEEKERYIVSFGFIHSPKNGQRDQPWHLDYGHQVSNLFVPLNELTIHNSTQFIRGPYRSIMPESNNFPGGPAEIMKNESKKWLEVAQLVCKPFMILKLYCSTVHRGKRKLSFLYSIRVKES